ncbi:FUSC family protein [Streptomyces formicae]|uniref:Integral membrane protein n=1 Tax=Streptomyces formicae TaxID=1616117 RepID=A0A291Q7R0_9ACTN|nr:aromatic acid exporter family protein [Streptomyces formicae]ATL27535.1 integral membrane protein [Streptomyces formicae]
MPHTPWNLLTAEAGAVARSARRAVTSAGPERGTAVQALKAAAAALIAWAVAGWWWGAPLAILAPWTAVVLVHHTVYRSLRSAGQQFVVVATGTLVAAAAAALTRDAMAALALAMPVTVLIGTYGRFGDQGWYAPTAALFVLTYGSYAPVEILHRLLETLLGAVIGVLVNALVLPPVHTGGAWRLRTRVPADCAGLLREVADGIEHGYDAADAEDWHGRALGLGATVAELRSARRHADESRRLNPGRRMRRSPPGPPPVDVPWDRVADQLAAALRSLAETAHENPRFAAPTEQALGALATLLRSAADVCAVDADRSAGGRGDEDRADRALDAARDAGTRLASLLTDPEHGTTASLGELIAATTRLLDDLEAATDHSGRTRASDA